MKLNKIFNSQIEMLKAIFTNNKYYYAKQTWEKYILCNRLYLTEAISKLLDNPDVYMDAKVLKHDATTTVSLVNIDNKKIIIKRYNIKGFRHALKRAIQPSRAYHCWKSAHQLLWFNIATSQPIAIIENRFGPLRKQAYFIYEYIPGPEGFEVFCHKPATAAITQVRAENTAALIKKLFANAFSHGDLKASNFVYEDNTPYFIDLDAMQRHRFQFTMKRRKNKEIKRFLQNWSDANIYLLFSKLLR